MVRSTSCQRSSDSASGRRIDRPALLIRMSIPPMRFSTSSTSASIASMSERSQGSDIAVPPSPVIRSATASSRSLRRATATTTARCSPNCLVAAAPMPDDAPVSRMRLPVRSTGCIAGRLISSCGEIGGRMPANVICSVNQRSGLLLTAGESSFAEPVVTVVSHSSGFCSATTASANGRVRNSAETGSSRGDASVGRRRGLRRPRRSCRPGGWPHRQTVADPPARRRAG
ncbi:Uncharacterised protein [Mycobacterium tuberculosis]|uniref:Uncharacterized protein n=1 Tax=Mycobacterium tuberculosis TaxID=1773 RepID=A0A655AGW6_MYCTX|nr:Uncharacterised protein [Mycobacterium tuberculosis]CKT02735.1 Uncharacterised protein [Mycobacterium tuberculosis]CNM48857.1 Uncharacterised protein [Mycobacterium tuberculosis]CNM65404.1 Uncharacterised protein [Mycobacterium tuberculosis]CNN19819.1 Uncharacterised protein [Mycobacterium tuberculosis]